MNQVYQRKKQFGRALAAVIISVCAAVGLMVCSTGGGSHAPQQQQGRDRHLAHTDSKGAGEGKRLALVIGNYTNTAPIAKHS